jgi:hypothetical protein
VGVVRRVGVLSLVDLAGSENAKLTNATGTQGQRGMGIHGWRYIRCICISIYMENEMSTRYTQHHSNRKS